jgi:toxin ParE1/3/4
VYSVVIEREAQEEFEAAYRYYKENASLNVADTFHEDFEASLDVLEINPFYQVRTKSYRAIPLKKFPYLLFFEIEESDKIVKILALFHTSQNPSKWP